MTPKTEVDDEGQDCLGGRLIHALSNSNPGSIASTTRYEPKFPRCSTSRRTSFPIRLHFRRLTIGFSISISAKYQTNKSENHQDGSGYHQPMRILHRLEHGLF